MKPEDGKEARQHSQSQNQWVQGVLKEESHGSSFPDMSKRVSSFQNPVTNPDMYSTTLAKEATIVRRVLEPLFHHFDVENHGSSDTGVACSVILYLQLLLEESAELSNVVDDIAKWNADLQYAIENCISQLSKKVGDAGAILDMMSGLLENISNNTVIARSGSFSFQDEDNFLPIE
ncbi:hypothetical protein Patl1_07110 [Pistacia atlantica]|uniref:Uncharacterized protein n=1 Tax=Pistacia atlantica TaxID=434234 RepID=A0ACC1AE73_9ROSI|nr:hypothetical protein Patl1_07110 [Pistacia atlantica]